MPMSRKRIVFFSLVLVGCGGSGLTDTREPEDRGTLILDKVETDIGSNVLIWTKDGSEVVFASGGLKAVNISSHAVRALTPSTFIERAARGDEWIYYITPLTNPTANGLSFTLSRVHPSQGTVENIELPDQKLGPSVVVSRDERWIGLGGLLMDMQNGTTTPLPNGSPLGFSPDGARLLYVLGSATTSPYVMISTADGVSQPVSTGQGTLLVHRWVGGSPQFLTLRGGESAMSPQQLWETDGISGTTRQLWETSDRISYLGSRWSDDDQTLAIWVEKGMGLVSNELTLLRTGASPTVIATVNALNVETPAFSPSGTSIVYSVFTATGLFIGGYNTFYLKSGI